MNSVAQNIASIPDFIRLWAATTREGHRFAQQSQEHADKMLTWTIGLMGAGIFSSREFLAQAPLNLRFAALLPWIVGILFAVAGRLLAADLIPRNNLHHFDRVSRMETLLVMKLDEATVRDKIDVIFNDEEGLAEKAADLRWRLHLTNACFYAAHIALALGVVCVVLVAYCAGR